MKKLLLIVAMLLAVSSVMADVTITAYNEGTFSTPDGNRAAHLRIGYSGTTNVRAFALDINVDSGCNFWNIRDFNVGENNYPNKPNGYGIFPGRFRSFIQPLNGTDVNSTGANGRYGWADTNYNPLPPWGDPGATNTGYGYGKIIAEMGYLGAGDANKPPQSGTLFRVDVNAYRFTGTAHVTITADAMRGGVVDKDTNATTTATVTYVATDVCFPCVPVAIPSVLGSNQTDANTTLAAAGFGLGTVTTECNNTYAAGLVCRQDTGSQCTSVPVNIVLSTGPCCTTPTPEVGALRATAEGVWLAQNFTLSGTAVYDCAHVGVIISQDTACVSTPTAIHYTYGVDDQVPNVVGMTRAAALAALAAHHCTAGTEVNGFGGAVAVGSVYAQSVPAATSTCTSSVVALSVSSYPMKDTALASLYANWVTLGKPQCWAYPRQCRGDADGKKLGTQWVSGNDLIILKSAITKALTAIPPGGRCADFDHAKLGTQWVSGNDLIILKRYITKAESLIPMCGNVPPTGSTDPNYWYWCVPTGGTCPTGQYCATAGSCPNTP
jgi:hypothetical protein